MGTQRYPDTYHLGKPFGRLTPYARDWSGKQERGPWYLCKCECGNEFRACGYHLRSGMVRSCGCLGRDYTRQHKWRGHGDIPGTLWSKIKWHADKRKIAWNISIEEAWALFEKQGRRCALTGWPLVIRPRDSAHNASLDRIDSSGGYTIDNVQWVHKDVNWMKNEFTQERFIAVCEAVTNHRKQHGHQQTRNAS